MTVLLADFLFSLNAILPVFLLMMIGILLKKIGLLNAEFSAAADKLVFRVALPAMLFTEVASASFSDVPEASFLLFVVASVSAAFLIVSFASAPFLRLFCIVK